jgi:YD repeat-containing protein
VSLVCRGRGCFVHGQWLSHDRSVAEREYGYDAAGRLVEAAEQIGGVCQTRSYAFGNDPAGRNSNRTAKTVVSADEHGECDPGTTATTGYVYDAADRLLSGLAYDGFGRATTVPGTLLDRQGPLQVGYFANDLARSLSRTV